MDLLTWVKTEDDELNKVPNIIEKKVGLYQSVCSREEDVEVVINKRISIKEASIFWQLEKIVFRTTQIDRSGVFSAPCHKPVGLKIKSIDGKLIWKGQEYESLQLQPEETNVIYIPGRCEFYTNKHKELFLKTDQFPTKREIVGIYLTTRFNCLGPLSDLTEKILGRDKSENLI